MKKKGIIGLVLASAMLMGVLAACAPTVPPAAPATPQEGNAAPTAPAPGTPAAAPESADPGARPVGRGVTIAVNQETPTMAPGRHGTVHGHWKNMQTHNGLFRIAEDLSPIPDLITSVTAISDVLFEFTLHEGVMFHNGEELTAYDVINSLDFMRDFPEGAGQRTAVQSGEVIDRYTFRLYTGTPNALMFFELAHHANFILPSSLIEIGNDFNVNPIGSGPFVFEEWTMGDSLFFTSFDNYFDVDRTPRVEYIRWRVIPEGATRTIALETGEVEFNAHPAFPDIPRLEANPNITVHTIPGSRIHYMLFNHTLPLFQDVYVRRIIDMAVDREAVVLAAFDGFGIPIIQQFPPALPGASAVGTRGFDPDGARELMAERGINPADLALDMLLISEEQRRKGEVVQANLADIGIPATITQIDLGGWLGHANAAQHDIAVSTFTPGALLGFLRATVHSAAIGAQNWSHINDPVFTEMIDQAIATIDEPARIALLYEITQRANEQVVWIPTNMNVTAKAHDARLVMPEISASGNMYLNMIYWMD
ncbi:MAG: ABC transporter substrate-binding protein [Defluviitaleaceae bacterium]|nr:ABC transporter substrate-binding protein [Defluviitaleaceae bacterium]